MVMSSLTQLRIQQLDQQFAAWTKLPAQPPAKGWLATIRTALGMPMNSLATKLGITATGIKRMEQREANGSISLQVLRKAADALDMHLVYALVPKDGSLQKLIERRALAVAQEIVLRTHQTMTLEGQAVTDERLREAIAEKAEELQREMPRILWR